MLTSEMLSFSLYHVRFLHKVSMKIQENHTVDIKNLIYKNLKNKLYFTFLLICYVCQSYSQSQRSL